MNEKHRNDVKKHKKIKLKKTKRKTYADQLADHYDYFDDYYFVWEEEEVVRKSYVHWLNL